jgi:hypothetical protein
MATIDISAGEMGITRVFSLSMDGTAAKQLRDDRAAQTKALGAAPQNPAGIEVFPLADLGELGLAGFLREGVDAHPDDIARDKVKLAALDGWVMLVHSLAFSTEGATLTPATPLTLIGTYGQTPAPRDRIPLEAESAAPYTGTPPAGLPEITRSRSPAGWIITILALLAVIILVWAFA